MLLCGPSASQRSSALLCLLRSNYQECNQLDQLCSTSCRNRKHREADRILVSSLHSCCNPWRIDVHASIAIQRLGEVIDLSDRTVGNILCIGESGSGNVTKLHVLRFDSLVWGFLGSITAKPSTAKLYRYAPPGTFSVVTSQTPLSAFFISNPPCPLLGSRCSRVAPSWP